MVNSYKCTTDGCSGLLASPRPVICSVNVQKLQFIVRYIGSGDRRGGLHSYDHKKLIKATSGLDEVKADKTCFSE